MNRLICIPTCWKYASRAQTIRETWAPFCADNGFDLKFFIGRQPGVHTMGMRVFPDDTVFLQVDDDYFSLPLKVQAMFSWAISQGYEQAFKTDDDCYVVPELLARVPAEGHYVGRMRLPSGGYPAWFASGFAYWLSRAAMTAIHCTRWNGDWAEDRFVGNALAYNGFCGLSDKENYAPVGPTLPPRVIVRCNIKNAAVFCEFPNPQEMLELHDILRGTRKPNIQHKPLVPAPFIAVTAADLFKAATDIPHARYGAFPRII